MFTTPTTRPDGLPALDEASAWEIALDSSRAEHERLPALWTLFSHAPLQTTAERLLPLLEDPTLWLGSEVLEVVRAIGADDQLSVRGVPLNDVDRLHDALGAELPWARHPRCADDPPCIIFALRGRSIDPVHWDPPQMPPSMKTHRRIENAGWDFPWSYGVLPVGDVFCFAHHTGVELGRLVALDRGKVGVLSFKPLRAIVIESAPRREHPFAGWRVVSIDDDTFAIRGSESLPPDDELRDQRRS